MLPTGLLIRANLYVLTAVLPHLVLVVRGGRFAISVVGNTTSPRRREEVNKDGAFTKKLESAGY